MTDLDPLHATRTGEDLAERAGPERPEHATPSDRMEMDGPTGREGSTEVVGDPDRSSVESGAASGAGAGALAGTAIAGPFGLPIGAAIGAAAGAAAEAADEDRDTSEDRSLAEPGSSGTGPVDPSDGASHPGGPSRTQPG